MLRKKFLFLALIMTFILSFSVVANADTNNKNKLSDKYTVTFEEAGVVLKKIKVNKGESIKDYPTQDSSENFILGWVLNGKKINDPTSLIIEEDTLLTAWKAPYINISTHHSYINGNGGQFRPNDSLSRAEFCVIFDSLYNIFNNNCSIAFTDLSSDEWYYGVVSKIISAGIMTGYEDGTFRPNDKMTRAEFISVLCCGAVFGEGKSYFSDIENHWARNIIAYAYENSWLTEESGTLFRPDEPITRAEAVVIFNRILGRNALLSHELLSESNVSPFYDVKPSDPYYCDIMEATVEHTSSGKGVEEVWTDFNYKPCGYSPGIIILNDKGYVVDSNGQFCFLPAWSFVEINGNTYFTNSEGTINLSFKGLNEIYGSLYYFSDHGYVYKDAYFENLYFGPDGKYTSGNAEIDAYVEDLLAKITNDGMTKEQKLYSAYIYIRDAGKYLGRTHYARGSSDFTEEAALFMFKNGMKGNCYCFASCFLYVAKRLGYQDAYIVSGGVGKKNLNHAWVMINGNIYDVELEYAHLYQYADKHHYNLFNLPINDEPFHYYFPE